MMFRIDASKLQMLPFFEKRSDISELSKKGLAIAFRFNDDIILQIAQL